MAASEFDKEARILLPNLPNQLLYLGHPPPAGLYCGTLRREPANAKLECTFIPMRDSPEKIDYHRLRALHQPVGRLPPGHV